MKCEFCVVPLRLKDCCTKSEFPLFYTHKIPGPSWIFPCNFFNPSKDQNHIMMWTIYSVRVNQDFTNYYWHPTKSFRLLDITSYSSLLDDYCEQTCGLWMSWIAWCDVAFQRLRLKSLQWRIPWGKYGLPVSDGGPATCTRPAFGFLKYIHDRSRMMAWITYN